MLLRRHRKQNVTKAKDVVPKKEPVKAEKKEPEKKSGK